MTFRFNYTYADQPMTVEVNGTSKKDACVWFSRFYAFDGIERIILIETEQSIEREPGTLTLKIPENPLNNDMKEKPPFSKPSADEERELIKSKIAELEWLIDHGEGALDKGATGDEIMYSHNDFKYDLEDRIEYWEEELKKITNRSRNDQRK